jgi:hypothetical protein
MSRPPWRTLARLTLLAALVLPLGCVNPFKPADPEPPDSSGVPEDFHTTAAVLQTMALAVDSKTSGGATAWLHAFADSQVVGDRGYRQYYDGAVKQNWETGNTLKAPEPWDITLERNLPTKLFGIRPLGTYDFEWGRDDGSGNDEEGPDTTLLHRHYTLKSTQGNNEEIIAIGYCDLSLVNLGSRWAIFRWVDRLDGTIGVNPSSDARAMSFWRLESLARP